MNCPAATTAALRIVASGSDNDWRLSHVAADANEASVNVPATVVAAAASFENVIQATLE
jgi:hypothetical protein